ncbi:hypothetical protein M407DRAFT_30220 [Tulasnella calospora MUT 4182]|uniref:Pali-domain-containing protein n=1 Tax=Tulasnella calospora MUT 4182 TaxID=1051891 RepID=A0A0C3KF45_9AGAM|nr:hypothetical protein M407DRAFT_30220 [Tulasnella calospora MUT 4182]
MATAWRRKPIQIITPLLLFAAFILLLLVSLSLPIIKSIYLFEISAKLQDGTPITSIATTIRVGLWGYCASGWSFAGPTPKYEMNQACYGPQVGYKISPVILNLIQSNELANVLLDSLTPVLIIHPVACGLTLLTAIPTIIHLFKTTIPGFVEVCTLLIGIIPTLVTTIDVVVDIVFVIVARQRIDKVTQTLAVYWGPAVWMTCAATACLWVGLIGLAAYACGCCGLSDHHVEMKLRKRYIFTEKPQPDGAESP